MYTYDYDGPEHNSPFFSIFVIILLFCVIGAIISKSIKQEKERGAAENLKYTEKH